MQESKFLSLTSNIFDKCIRPIDANALFLDPYLRNKQNKRSEILRHSWEDNE